MGGVCCRGLWAVGGFGTYLIEVRWEGGVDVDLLSLEMSSFRVGVFSLPATRRDNRKARPTYSSPPR